MQIADIVRRGFGQDAFGRGTLGEILPALRIAALPRRGGLGHLGDFFGVEQDFGVRAHQLDRQLVDEIVLAAEGGRQRQRHRPGTDIDTGAEQRGEIGAGLGDQRDAVFLGDPGRHQPAGHDQRVIPHFAIGIDPRQLAAHVVKIKTLAALRGVVDRVVECCKLRTDPWQGAVIRRRRQNGLGHII